MLIMSLSSVSVIWFGGHRIDSGQMQIGALTAFLTYVMQILMAVMMSTTMMMIRRVAVAADRIGAVLDTESSVVEPATPVTLRPAGRRAARSRDLRGGRVPLPGCRRPVLTGRSFTAEPGTTTAIVGSPTLEASLERLRRGICAYRR